MHRSVVDVGGRRTFFALFATVRLHIVRQVPSTNFASMLTWCNVECVYMFFPSIIFHAENDVIGLSCPMQAFGKLWLHRKLPKHSILPSKLAISVRALQLMPRGIVDMGVRSLALHFLATLC